MSGTHFNFVGDALILQYPDHLPAVERKVAETKNRYKVRVMYANNISDFTLKRRDDASAKDHHYKERRPLRGVFSNTCYGQRKN